jgi:hypothetical protein
MAHCCFKSVCGSTTRDTWNCQLLSLWRQRRRADERQTHMDYLLNKPRRWKMRLGPVVLPISSSGQSSPIIRRNQPKHNVKEKRIALSRTQFRFFRLAFHSLSFLLCSSRQPYNARAFSNLWLGIGAPTRSAPCVAAQAAHPWSQPCRIRVQQMPRASNRLILHKWKPSHISRSLDRSCSSLQMWTSRDKWRSATPGTKMWYKTNESPMRSHENVIIAT